MHCLATPLGAHELGSEPVEQDWMALEQAKKLLALSKGLGVLARSGVRLETLRGIVGAEMALLSPKDDGRTR